MNRDDIIRMAREAEFYDVSQMTMNVEWTCVLADIERFAALVAAAEREACAKVCDSALSDEIEDEAYYIVKDIAVSIRARRRG